MTTKHRTRKTPRLYRLDSKSYMVKVGHAGELADKALQPYGEPTMSLAQLRVALAQQLGDVSLSELIIKEREAGW